MCEIEKSTQQGVQQSYSMADRDKRKIWELSIKWICLYRFSEIRSERTPWNCRVACESIGNRKTLALHPILSHTITTVYAMHENVHLWRSINSDPKIVDFPAINFVIYIYSVSVSSLRFFIYSLMHVHIEQHSLSYPYNIVMFFGLWNILFDSSVCILVALSLFLSLCAFVCEWVLAVNRYNFRSEPIDMHSSVW